MHVFANESESESIGDLTIENRTDRVEFYGSLSITKDKKGLEHARKLSELLTAMLVVLEAEALPEHIQEKPASKVRNPFK